MTDAALPPVLFEVGEASLEAAAVPTCLIVDVPSNALTATIASLANR